MRKLALAFMIVISGAPRANADGEGASIRALPVPTMTINVGELVTSELLNERKFRTTARSLDGFVTDSSEIIGKEARRRLIAGRPIPAAALGKPVALKRGTSAVAFYREEGFSISAPVIALSDGAEGAIIVAKSTETGAVIKVKVLSNGELLVVSP